MTSTTHSGPGFKPTGRLHFGVSLVGPGADTDFEQLRTLAQTAERGLFSLLALDERYWQGGDPGPASGFDPAGSHDISTLLAALASVTTNIGLVATAGPDYDDPADLVHRIASLDRVSGGRAAWSLLADGTSWRGKDSPPASPHAEQAEQHAKQHAGQHAGQRTGAISTGAVGGAASSGDAACGEAREDFVDSAQRIWDIWGSAGGPAAGPVERLGQFQHGGQKYSVGLGQVGPPAPRYRPVLFHGAGSARERAFAARHADAVVSGPAGLGDALELRRDLAARILDAGRGVHEVKIFQSGTFILADTAAEATERADWIRGQLPAEAWDAAAFIGSYSDVADRLLDFARAGAVDGFTITPWLNPGELADIVNHLVPELQDRGIYPKEYAGGPLRDSLALHHTAPLAAESTHKLPAIDASDLEDLHLDIRMELVVQRLTG